MRLSQTTIIAEAGVNHNGSINTAKEMIDVAVEADANFVKFQTFKAEALVTRSADKAEYQKNLTDKSESQFDMIKKLELDRAAHDELIQHCEEKGIRFLSTAFDHGSIDMLAELDISLYKIPSGEITNLPYLRHIGHMGKPVIMSTGMATLVEVRAALNILLETGVRKNQITILHCNTEYPTSMKDVNLRAMLTIRDELGVAVGYSDHTLGIEIPIAAVAMGATVIEKHFTLDRTLSGPDHASSLEPDELKAMVSAIRDIEKALGDGVKKPTSREVEISKLARKSLVYGNNLVDGSIIKRDDLHVKRPGTGINPFLYDEMIGRRLIKNVSADQLVKMDDFE